MEDLQVESGDLIAYGLLPEFTGRLPILVSLSALNEDQLVRVCILFKFFPIIGHNMLTVRTGDPYQ